MLLLIVEVRWWLANLVLVVFGIFSSELQQIMPVEMSGASVCQFYNSNGIAITEDGHAFVADCGNNRIQVLTMEGQFLELVGTRGKGLLQFQCPASTIIRPNGQVL